MSAEASTATQLVPLVTLLGAAVVAVPLFRRLGLGSVLGYLAAGLAIGPFGFRVFTDPQAILHVAELGVVMFLFIIGLEMKPSHLWAMRQRIFGLGSLQVLVCGALLTAVGVWGFGASLAVAFVAGMGFVLTSTAIVMQLLTERGDIAQPAGQRMVAILLFEDLLIVPLLAIVAFLAPPGAATGAGGSLGSQIGMALLALGLLVAAGVWLLDPLFRVLARAKAREVFTAAALLVVLGAALLMELGGLSMAMGAFVAGVLLSESAFRHQLEADIEPFRGLLMGLFFMAVGMSLDLAVVANHAWQIAAGVLALMLVKGLCVYAVARLARSGHAEALDRAIVMAQGGEFAFVLYAAALAQGVFEPQINAIMTAVVVLSMALTPLAVTLHQRLARPVAPSTEGLEAPHGLCGSVLIVGFGRVGQIVVQSALLRGADITIIDSDPTTIRDAEAYGFKVYYGDGARTEVLHAAGAAHARAIVVCIDDRAAATHIAETAKQEFPQAELLVRAYDREHALALVKTDADFVVRETFESALLLGRETVRALGASEGEADDHVAELRRRDTERFALEVSGGRFAGRDLVLRNMTERKEGPDSAAETDPADAAVAPGPAGH